MEDGLVHQRHDTRVDRPPGLNPCCNGRWSRTNHSAMTAAQIEVLILVVMEDGLVHNVKANITAVTLVLILVVMEDGLVQVEAIGLANALASLNPCCNGRWSRTRPIVATRGVSQGSLNPCCNGRWSRTERENNMNKNIIVLILVVMEDGLVLVMT